MIDFVLGVLQGPAWIYLIIVGCVPIVWWAYDLREITHPSAWVALALFFVWVTASHAWQLVPSGDVAGLDLPELEEHHRLWYKKAEVTMGIAFLWAGTVTGGVLFGAACLAYFYRLKITMLALLYGLMGLAGQLGESIERPWCKLRDPYLGLEHIYKAQGGRAPSCSRAVADLFEQLGWSPEIGSFIGPSMFPFVTVVPVMFIIWVTVQKKRKAATVR